MIYQSVHWYCTCDYPDCRSRAEATSEYRSALFVELIDSGWLVTSNRHYCPDHRDAGEVLARHG